VADNKLEYRLVIKDDGTITLKKISTEVDALGKKTVTTSKVSGTAVKGLSAEYDALLNKFPATVPKIKPAHEELSSLDRTLQRLQRTAIAFIGMAILSEALKIPRELISAAVEYNSTLETTKLGISAILVAQGTFRDSQGEALIGTNALNAAMGMASDISKQLQVDNLETAATYEQLAKAYQQTLAPGLEAKLNPNQIREYTVAMIQAASALGVNLDMLAEETRSMLRGTITPRNTLIATALGIRNEDIARYRGDADSLFNYIMGRLSAFKNAGEESQKTWAGMLSNVKDSIAQVLGVGMKNVFDYLKQSGLDLQKFLIIRTPEGLAPNPEVISAIRTVGDAFIGILKTVEAIATAIWGWREPISIAYESIRGMAIFLEGILKKIAEMNKGGQEGVPQHAPGSWQEKFIKSMGLEGKVKKSPFEETPFMLDESFNRSLSEKLKAHNDRWAKFFKTEEEKLKDRIEAAMDLENELAQVGTGKTTYEPREYKLTQAEQEEQFALRDAVGEVTDLERARAAVMLGLVDIATDLHDKTKVQIAAQAELNGLTKAQILDAAKVQLAYQKSTIPEDKGKTGLFNTEAWRAIEVESAKQMSTIASLQNSIGGLTKNYELQKLAAIDSGNASIRSLMATGKYTQKQIDLMKQLTKEQVDQIDRAKLGEKLGSVMEELGARASMAGATGDVKTQIEYEMKSFETGIEKRKKAQQELRGIEGERAELALREQNDQQNIIRLEKDRLDYVNRTLAVRTQIADATENYVEQANLVIASNNARKEQLTIEGKLAGIDGARLSILMDEQAVLQATLVNINGKYNLQKQELDLYEQIAEANSDITAQLGIQYRANDLLVKNLQDKFNLIGNKFAESKTELEGILSIAKEMGETENVEKLLVSISKLGDEYKEVREALERIIKLTKEAGEAKISKLSTESWLTGSEKIAELEQQIYAMTGDVEKLNTAFSNTLSYQRIRLNLDSNFKDRYEEIEPLITELERLQKISRDLSREMTVLTIKKDLASSAGNWEVGKIAEQELLAVELNRKLALEGLTEEGKKYAEQLYKIQFAELEAAKTMNGNALAEIGMKKYSLRVTQDLVDMYQNTFPNAIDMTGNAISNLTTDLVTGAKSWSEAWNDFFKSLQSGLVKLAADILMTIAKLEMLKALGYETTGSSVGGGGGFNWGGLAMAAAGAYFGGGGGGGEITGYGEAGSGVGSWESGGGGIIRKYAEGGLITKPTMAMIGEKGTPEAVVPMKDGFIPVSIKKYLEGEKGESTKAFISLKSGDIPVAFDKFAEGGIVTRPTLALAGENSRPEAFIPLKSGHVPVEMNGAKQAPSINVQMTVVTPDANSFGASRKQIIGGMFSEAARAAMRNS
jgi:hypothetical protein